MIALWFIALHMLGDYVTQNQWMANLKIHPRPKLLPSPPYQAGTYEVPTLDAKLVSFWARSFHVAVYSLPFAILGCATLPEWAALWMWVSIFIPHWIIDCRRWASPDPWPPKPIMVDQALHALHLAIVATVFYGMN